MNLRDFRSICQKYFGDCIVKDKDLNLVNMICMFCVGGDCKSDQEANMLIDFDRVNLLESAITYLPSVI